MNKKTIAIIALALAVAILAASTAILAVKYFKQETRYPVTEFKQSGFTAPIFQPLYFSGAVEKADKIVVGKVTEIGPSQNATYDFNYGSTSLTEYFKYITISVETVVKGDEDLKTVQYKEYGGQFVNVNRDGTASVECFVPSNYSGSLALGDEVLIFLNKDGEYLNPETLIFVDGNKITLSTYLIPDSIPHETEEGTGKTIWLSNYIDAIKEELNK